MVYFLGFCYVLLILALLGLIGSIAGMVLAALRLKPSVMTNVKRLYEPPLQSVKSLIATGKGLAQQEGVRAKHIGASAREAATAVKGVAGEVKTAATGVHFSELKPVLNNLQNVFRVLGLAAQFARTGARQGSAAR